MQVKFYICLKILDCFATNSTLLDNEWVNVIILVLTLDHNTNTQSCIKDSAYFRIYNCHSLLIIEAISFIISSLNCAGSHEVHEKLAYFYFILQYISISGLASTKHFFLTRRLIQILRGFMFEVINSISRKPSLLYLSSYQVCYVLLRLNWTDNRY